eukprot:225033-Rhodomonas_salina.5
MRFNVFDFGMYQASVSMRAVDLQVRVPGRVRHRSPDARRASDRDARGAWHAFAEPAARWKENENPTEVETFVESGRVFRLCEARTRRARERAGSVSVQFASLRTVQVEFGAEQTFALGDAQCRGTGSVARVVPRDYARWGCALSSRHAPGCILTS